MTTFLSDEFIKINTTNDGPYYRQIYERFRNAITSGVLKPGDRVPSARALTKELGLARGTIDSAYSLLTAEGYLHAKGQAGTFVSPDLKPNQLGSNKSPIPITTTFNTDFRPESILPFQMGLPAVDEFPRKIWARLGARRMRAMQPNDMTHPSVYGLSDLRQQIASYLQVSRGINCSPSQVFVTSGYRHSLEMIVHAVLKKGDAVWIENPGYPPTKNLLNQLLIKTVSIPVDEEGMQVEHGIQTAPEARVAVVSPAHQSPLGVSLGLSRRIELLDWASKKKSWIVEDDYDGEYRYISRPLPALKSLDREGRVLYLGTFSKVLFPAIRLAYLVVPSSEIKRFESISQTFSGGSPEVTQSIVSAFMREGHFSRHIQRMRKLYAERRTQTAVGLMNILGNQMHLDKQPGGMHLILRLQDGHSDVDLSKLMRQNGLYAEALSEWFTGPTNNSALLLNFTNINSQSNAEMLAQRILKLL